MSAEPAVAAAAPPVTDAELRQWRRWVPVALAFYLAWTGWAIGLRAEHFVIVAFFLVLFFASPKTAHFAKLVLPFLGVGVLYDNLRLVVGYRGEVHVADLWHAELAWFGVNTASGPMIPAMWLKEHTNAFLDTLCGFAYLAYIVETFAFGIYLYFRDQKLLTRFGWGFLAVNFFGMIIYMLYPAAPPWYVEQYGLGPAILEAKPSPAGAARFDALWGVQVFSTFYSRNANVFGAMPSLHVAYPTVVMFASFRLGAKWGVPAILFMLLVAFSAIYLQHHYILDLVAGMSCATLTWVLITWVFNRRERAV